MKRSAAILLWILAGAVAAGLGVGYFLHAANVDRERLADQARLALVAANETRAATERLAQEANQKLSSASAEVARAQELIQHYQEDQTLMAQATVLVKPTMRTLRNWQESISLSLGLSLWIPPGSRATQTDQSVSVSASDRPSIEPWMTVNAYDPHTEQMLLQNATATDPLTYLVAGHLLAGWKGLRAATAETIYVLHIRSAASSTHLIWAKAHNASDEKKILDTLATLGFKS